MEDISGTTGGTVMHRTSEDFTYQNEKFYFGGELIQDEETGLKYLHGGGSIILEGGSRKYLGQISIVYGDRRPRINYLLTELEYIEPVSELTQKLISII